jgi:hypothetical protein
MAKCQCNPKSPNELCLKCQMEYNDYLDAVEASGDADAHLEAIEMGLQQLEDEGMRFHNER